MVLCLDTDCAVLCNSLPLLIRLSWNKLWAVWRFSHDLTDLLILSRVSVSVPFTGYFLSLSFPPIQDLADFIAAGSYRFSM